MRIYLDNCCFNRPFDDQSQLRIKLEAEAKLKIQEEIRSRNLEMVWSYILDYENSKNPYEERRIQIQGWKKYSIQDIQKKPKIIKLAKQFNRNGLKKMDSLHIACAIETKCVYFITTDDKVLNKSEKISEIKIIDPFGFIKEQIS